MTTRDTNDIHELTDADLEIVSGGSIVEGVRTAVRWPVRSGFAFFYSYGETIDHQPDPWG